MRPKQGRPSIISYGATKDVNRVEVMETNDDRKGETLMLIVRRTGFVDKNRRAIPSRIATASLPADVTLAAAVPYVALCGMMGEFLQIKATHPPKVFPESTLFCKGFCSLAYNLVLVKPIFFSNVLSHFLFYCFIYYKQHETPKYTPRFNTYTYILLIFYPSFVFFV